MIIVAVIIFFILLHDTHLTITDADNKVIKTYTYRLFIVQKEEKK